MNLIVMDLKAVTFHILHEILQLGYKRFLNFDALREGHFLGAPIIIYQASTQNTQWK